MIHVDGDESTRYVEADLPDFKEIEGDLFYCMHQEVQRVFLVRYGNLLLLKHWQH